MTNVVAAPSKNVYYDVLDGLRGVAAITVMVFHYFEMMCWPDYDTIPIGHGYLAVDFFFCLSGFIIAFAYDGRMKSTGMKTFLVNRLIRLHPMVVMGTVLGLMSYLLNPFLEISVGFQTILLAVVCSLFMIPYSNMPYREGELFPYNTPIWSLFFEYIANIAYVLVLSKMRKGVLLFLGIISAVGLIYCAQRSGWLIHGWNIDHLSDGFARVSFSFIAGMLVYRFKWIMKNKLPFAVLFILLAGILSFPHIENDWITECIFVIVLFPLIISLGAGAVVEGVSRKFCLFIGKLSYPLYLTHITIVTIFGNYYWEYKPQGIKLVLVLAVLMICNILLAYIILRFYDEPVRKWLKKLYKLNE